MMRTRQTGITLLELMVTLAVFGIIISIAVPSMGDFVEKRRLVGAAEEVYGHLMFTRTEAVKQSTDMRVSFNAAQWCLGTRSGANDCDCTENDESVAGACAISMAGTNVLSRVLGSDFPQITLAHNFSGNQVTFNGVRGVVDGGLGTVSLSSPSGWQLNITTNILGRVRICDPGTGSTVVGGYPAC